MPILQDPLLDKVLLEPNLLIPGRKPVGPVEIDNNNQTTKGLVSAYLLNGIGDAVDLRSTNDGANNNVTLTTVNGDSSAYFNGSSAFYDLGSNSNLDTPDGLTILTRYVVRGGTGHRILWGNDQNPGYRYFDVNGSNQFCRFNNLSGDTLTGAATLSNNTPYTGACVWDGANVTLYLDGDVDATEASTGTLQALTNNYAIGQYGTSSGLYFNGEIFFLYIWRRGLSAREIKHVTDNPYSLFKPAASAPVFFPEAAVGGFQPAWAVNANQLIQSGGTMT